VSRSCLDANPIKGRQFLSRNILIRICTLRSRRNKIITILLNWTRNLINLRVWTYLARKYHNFHLWDFRIRKKLIGRTALKIRFILPRVLLGLTLETGPMIRSKVWDTRRIILWTARTSFSPVANYTQRALRTRWRAPRTGLWVKVWQRRRATGAQSIPTSGATRSLWKSLRSASKSQGKTVGLCGFTAWEITLRCSDIYRII
jgi:hypothetical protein